MKETEERSPSGDVPERDESPFTAPPIEGMPYERGSEEDAAIKRVLEQSSRE